MYLVFKNLEIFTEGKILLLHNQAHVTEALQ